MLSGVGTSKTRTLYLLLRDQIASGVLPPGHRIPGEPSLALEHGISRVTVRRALDALEADGLIRRQPGAGTFVAESGRDKPVVADFANMLAHLVDMGRVSRVKLLSFAYVAPPQRVARALGLEPNERTQYSVRVRYTDDLPFSHLVTHVPERIGLNWSDMELATQPLLALMERSGVRAERASQTVSAVLAGPEVAEALGVDVGSALLEVERTVYDEAGRGIEHLHALYRPDRYAFRMDMSRIVQHGEGRWRPVERAFEPIAPAHKRKKTPVSKSPSSPKRIRGASQ